ncbi:hypothetical protein LINGRAHAP2_LOCUS21644 [Linum grandiflorum]
MLEGLEWAVELGYTQIVVEPDCRAVQEQVADDTEFGRIIEACKVRVSSKPGLSVSFGRRNYNEAAHVLARRSSTSIVIVIGEIPPAWLSTAMVLNTGFVRSSCVVICRYGKHLFC